MPGQDQNNVYRLGAHDAGDMLREIIDLRQRIVTAWRERAVMLTREEQRQLHDEITATCEILGELKL
jgi:uncharacterized protein YukE